jgi:threonine dehydrogenase-like Zn-dependent dehydrogenase
VQPDQVLGLAARAVERVVGPLGAAALHVGHHVAEVQPGARIVVVGVCMETDRFEPFFGIVKQLNLQFVLGYTHEEFATSLRRIAEGKVDVTPLIAGHVELEGVRRAFAELANPEQHAKIVVQPWG